MFVALVKKGKIYKEVGVRHEGLEIWSALKLQTSERKNNGLESLKNHCRVKYTCDPLGVQPQDPKI